MDRLEDWVEAELARLRMRLFGWSPARREAALLHLASALVQEAAYARPDATDRILALMQHSAGLGLRAEAAGRSGGGAALPHCPKNAGQRTALEG